MQILIVGGKEGRAYQLTSKQLRKKSEKYKRKPKGSVSQGVLQANDFLIVVSQLPGKQDTTRDIHLTNEWSFFLLLS